MTRLARPALLCLLLLTAFAARGAAIQLEKVTLQLKWTHAFQFAGYYAAKELGYYREAGLDVTIAEARPGSDPVQEVIEGRAEFGVGNSSLLLSRKAGHPVTVLAVIFQHSPQVLVARQERPTQGIHDLVGKRVMLERNSDELVAYLRQEGIGLDRIVQMEHSFDPMDLIKGRVDAISAYVTNEPYYLDSALLSYQTYTPRAAGIDFYGDNWSGKKPSPAKSCSASCGCAATTAAAAVTPDGHIRLLLADCTGHGLAAALNVVPVVEKFYGLSNRGLGLAEVCVELNRQIHELMPAGRFVCAAIAEIDPAGRRIRVWNGGMPPVLCAGPDGRVAERWLSRHVALGILPAAEFDASLETSVLPPGGVVLLSSDGLAEAVDSRGVEFGEAGLLAMLRALAAGATLEEAARNEFEARGCQSHDDVTALAAKLDP